VREKRGMADERLDQCLNKNFRENKKMLWGGVNRK